MGKKWICVEITHRYNKTQHVLTLKNYLKKLFSEQQILFLGTDLDDQNFNNVLDGYFFIQCDNIEPYIENFKQSKYINNVLINYEQIAYIDDEQVQQMVDRFNQTNQSRQSLFHFGDVVKIKKGMFKNLYGIVDKVLNQFELVVVFKFVSGYRYQHVAVDNCEYKNNFFDVVRVGVNEL